MSPFKWVYMMLIMFPIWMITGLQTKAKNYFEDKAENEDELYWIPAHFIRILGYFLTPFHWLFKQLK